MSVSVPEPAPSAPALDPFAVIVPEFNIKPPLKVFPAESVSVPVPFLVRDVGPETVLLLIAPPNLVSPLPSIVSLTGVELEVLVIVPLMVRVFAESLIQV